MLKTPIDPNLYLRVPNVNVPGGLTLGRMLLAAVPKRPSPQILAAAQALRVDVDALEAQWKAKGRVRPAEDVRPYDYRVDRAWSAIASSLERYSIFAPTNPDRMRADELRARLFPEGLTFTQRPYLEQHAQSALRLDIIADEGLSEDLERLVGRAFVRELRLAHRAYGAALDITEAPGDASPSVSLLEPLRALGRAISSYTLQLLAFADLDPDRNTAIVLRALAPIDAFRSSNARRSTPRADDPEVLAEPEPELDPTTDDDVAETDADADVDLPAPVVTTST